MNADLVRLCFNSAYVLLADGGINTGKHPRGKSSEVVPTIGFTAAADIFYKANVGCLTPASNFAAARYCTAEIFGGNHTDAGKMQRFCFGFLRIKGDV